MTLFRLCLRVKAITSVDPFTMTPRQFAAALDEMMMILRDHNPLFGLIEAFAGASDGDGDSSGGGDGEYSELHRIAPRLPPSLRGISGAAS